MANNKEYELIDDLVELIDKEQRKINKLKELYKHKQSVTQK